MTTPPVLRLAPSPSGKADEQPALSRAPSPTALVMEPLLVNIKQAVALCGISEATWFRLQAARKTPEAVKIAGRSMFRLQDIRDWVAMGCPDRRTFEVRKRAGRVTADARDRR
jgi:predicted DNA-binding transcriptional regulator AlpA